MRDDAKLQQLSAEIRNDIEGCSEANGQSLRKAVDLGAKLRAAKDLRPSGGFQKWIEEQAFGVQYNWCSVCMRASEAADKLTAGERYSWEYIVKNTGTVKDLAAMRGKAHLDDPWAKQPPAVAPSRGPTLAQVASDLAALKAEVADLRAAVVASV